MKLHGGPWELEVRPERGGRITSLRLAGEELLDQGIGVDEPGAAGFVESGAWGWDEMVPTIEPIDSLPDHGEAWRVPWDVLNQTGSSVAMRCSGRSMAWQLTREIQLGDKAVHASYTYKNVGAEPQYAYWSAHPLFKLETGMLIGVADGMLENLPDGGSVKVFLPKASVDHVRLAWKSGLAVEVWWDPTLTPYVGVWVCNGDLGGYRQVAIEPATGGNDRPDPAAPPPMLPPGDQLRWWLEVRGAPIEPH